MVRMALTTSAFTFRRKACRPPIHGLYVSTRFFQWATNALSQKLYKVEAAENRIACRHGHSCAPLFACLAALAI